MSGLVVPPLAVARVTGDALLRRTCGACHREIEGVYCSPCWVAWTFEELAAVALQAARKPEPEDDEEHPVNCRCYECCEAIDEDDAWERAKEARVCD